MSDNLSVLDTMFLDLEEADSGATMHIGAAMVFDPAADGGAPDLDRLRAHLGERLHVLPRFHQRLSGTQTGHLSWLSWEPEERFDLDSHVRHATLPEPGGEAELLEWLGDFWSHRLDRRRPLWEMVLLDGLAGGRWVLASKTHHCLVDGVGSIDIGHLLLDVEPSPPPVRPASPSSRPAAEEAKEDHAGHRFWLSPSIVLNGARAGVNATLHPVEALEHARATAELIVREDIIPAPSCSLNVPITASRRMATLRVGLDDVRAIAHERGGTVNDVVLAACAGGLRHLLLSRDEPLPNRPLRAQIPVNIRTDDQEHALGNQLTSLFVELPVDEPDPLERYARVMHSAESLKHDGTQATGGKTLVDIASLGPPVVGALLGRATFNGPRAFNLTITNVPGPQLPLYALGSHLREVIPYVPLFAGHTVGIAVISYDGQMVFGLSADAVAAQDVAVLAEGIEASLAELRPALTT